MARYVPRPEPGAFPAGLLAVLVHVALAAMLIVGLRWQTKPPQAAAVEVELVRPSPVAEMPRVVPPPEPPVEVKPTPEPPPPPKPEPKVEVPPPPPKPQPKPDIALEQEKKRQEAKRVEDEKKRVEQKRADEKKRAEETKRLDEEKKRVAETKRREADAKAERARIDEQLRRELDRDQAKTQQDQIAREMASLKADQARRDASAKAAAASAGDSKARAEWADRIRTKIRPLIVMPDSISGNPTAVFAVVLLPTGDVVNARLTQSSGNKAWDEAVERAILKATPLPRPERDDVFVRELTLRFRPND